MGDRNGVKFPGREIYLSLTIQSGELSLAILLWVGAMSTGQKAVMLCRWVVKARVWWQVKLCDPLYITRHIGAL